MEIENNASKPKILVFMIIMVLAGSGSTITIKILQSIDAKNSGFYHPWFCTFIMFIGELLCLIPYFIFNANSNKKVEKKRTINSGKGSSYNSHSSRSQSLVGKSDGTEIVKPELSVFWVIIPALFDMCGSTLLFLGLTNMASSVYQMLRGSVILFIALGSIKLLKRRLFRHNWLGMILVLIGLLLVGIGYIYDIHNKEKDAQTSPWGVIMVIASCIFTAGLFICEELLMTKYKCHPLKLVGLEGLWGVIIYLVFLFLAYYIPCPVSDKDFDLRKGVCAKNDNDEWVLENIYFAVKQMDPTGDDSDPRVLVLILLYLIIIPIFNSVGVWITKNVSATARSIIDTIRTLIVWIVFLTVPVAMSIREYFDSIQLVGFIFCICGNIIYHEVLILPFWGLNKNTKEELRKEITEGVIQEEVVKDQMTQKLIDSWKHL